MLIQKTINTLLGLYLLQVPGTGSSPTVGDNILASTFTQQGIIDWTEGFHGSFNLNATAMGCDGVTTSPVSTISVVIESRAVTPTDIIIAGGSFLPSCPGSTASTEFYSNPGSGNSVTWSIDNNSAGVINCDTGVLTWDSDFFWTCKYYCNFNRMCGHHL